MSHNVRNIICLEISVQVSQNPVREIVLFHFTYEKAESQVKSEVSQVEVSAIQNLVLDYQYALGHINLDSFLSVLPVAFSVIFNGLK